MQTFSDYLKQGPLKNKLHTDLLRELHLSTSFFQGLDTVTLSRWVNDRTVPSLSKQLLMAISTNTLDLFFEYCDNIDITPSKSLSVTYQNFKKQFDNSYHQILMEPEQATIFQEYLTWEQYIKRTAFIRKKTKFLSLVDERITTIKQPLNKICFFSIRDENGRTISYSGIMSDPYKFSNILNIDEDILIDTTASIMPYYHNSSHENILRGLSLNHALIHSNKYHAYIMRGKNAMTLADAIASMPLQFFSEKNAIGNHYIYKMPTHELLGNSTCLPSILDARHLYKRLMNQTEIKLN